MGVLLSFCGIVKVCLQIPPGHLKDLTQAGQLIILDKPAVSLNFADKRLVNVHAQQLQLGANSSWENPRSFRSCRRRLAMRLDSAL